MKFEFVTSSKDGVPGMIPLMDRSRYDEFARLRLELEQTSPNIANVFVPVGCDPTKNQTFRILFVGKATRDYGDAAVETYDTAWRRDIAIATSNKSPFWSFVRGIVEGVGGRMGIDAAVQSPEQYLGWSNLAKIGDTRGNPTPDSLQMQAEQCVTSLKAEISLFAPTALVFLTGTYYGNSVFGEKEILVPLVGELGEQHGWQHDIPEQDRVAFKYIDEFHCSVFYTNHPQRMGPSGYRRAASTFIVDQIANKLF